MVAKQARRKPPIADDDNFYKRDEPASKIEAIWNRPGKKGRTKRPKDPADHGWWRDEELPFIDDEGKDDANLQSNSVRRTVRDAGRGHS